MQKSVIFVKKTLKINMLKIKQNCKDRDYCHYTDRYSGVVHRIYNLQHSVPKEILIVFHNGSIYDYHFIIKEPAQEYEKQFNCLGENAEKYLIFSVPMEKEVKNLIEKEKKSQKLHVTDYNLLIAQYLCQVYYQILLIISLREFIKLRARLYETRSELKPV